MLNQLQALLLLAFALLAWIRFAEHPSARNLRAALAATLGW